MKKMTNSMAVLFDLDGVVIDTETQYTHFWDEQGIRYLHVKDYGRRIKGQTLMQIFKGDFDEQTDVQLAITNDLRLFEKQMTFDYIAGVQHFIADLRQNQAQVAIVTSSGEDKMKQVYQAHPGFTEQFDRILTADMFTRSKPAPDCFLLGMELFGTTAQQTFVFEDSFHGLKAGRDSGATVIGLTTTNSREALEGKADYLIDDFRKLTYKQLVTWGERHN